MSKEEMKTYLERKAEQYCRQHAFALAELFMLTEQALDLDVDLDAPTTAARAA